MFSCLQSSAIETAMVMTDMKVMFTEEAKDSGRPKEIVTFLKLIH